MPRRDILVVDDNADVRETLAEVLELAGFAVRQAENGKVALEMAAARPPSLVLLDLMMPVMSGWQFLEEIRAVTSLASVPVVVISAATTNLPDGVPILTKPVSVDDLLDAVHHHATAPRHP